MDGVSSGTDAEGGNVIVVGATNRLDSIDAALLRKGRFHQILFVPLPTFDERLKLLEYFAEKCNLSEESYQKIRSSDKFLREELSGAEVENLCREEVMLSARVMLNANGYTY